MTKLIFVRHGEPDYSKVSERKYIGHGRDLAELTPLWKEQARKAARDRLLDGSELIVSSPYTRALQTAAIISKERNLDIEIELDLHEWLPDLTFTFDSDEFAINASRKCAVHKGICPENIEKKWENLENLFIRANDSLKKYLEYNKIIVISHGMLMRQFKFERQVPYCGIIEVEYDENFQWCGFIEED